MLIGSAPASWLIGLLAAGVAGQPVQDPVPTPPAADPADAAGAASAEPAAAPEGTAPPTDGAPAEPQSPGSAAADGEPSAPAPTDATPPSPEPAAPAPAGGGGDPSAGPADDPFAAEPSQPTPPEDPFAAVPPQPRGEQPRRAKDDRPFGRGTWLPSLGFGLGFSPDLTSIGVGVGVSYFVVPGLAPGLRLDNTTLIWGDSVTREFEGIEDETPTNFFRVLPSLTWVVVRSRWVNPYVTGAVGPLIFNNGGGTIGEWQAAVGAFFRLGGPVYLDLGVSFSQPFPGERCREAFRYSTADENIDVSGIGACDFGIGFVPGLALLF